MVERTEINEITVTNKCFDPHSVDVISGVCKYTPVQKFPAERLFLEEDKLPFYRDLRIPRIRLSLDLQKHNCTILVI